VDGVAATNPGRGNRVEVPRLLPREEMKSWRVIAAKKLYWGWVGGGGGVGKKTKVKADAKGIFWGEEYRKRPG